MNSHTKSKDCYNKLTKMFLNETVTYVNWPFYVCGYSIKL